METSRNGGAGDALRERALAIFYGVGGVVLALLALYVLVRLWPILVIVTVSLMFVAALRPLAKNIESRSNRRVATIVVVVGLLSVIAALLVFTVPPVIAQITTLARDFDALFGQIQQQIARTSPEMAELLGHIKVATIPGEAEPHAVKEVVFSGFTIVTGFVTVIMLTVYFVVEGPSAATALVSLFPRRSRLQIRQMFDEIGDQVGAYLRGQLFTSAMAGLSTYLVLTAFSVPNALALAWLMAVLDAVPIVGAILGTVPSVVSAYGVSSQTAVFVLICLVIYHQIESYWLVPRIYGRALKMKSLTVLLSILVGATLLGVAGAFIALPFAAMVPILLRHFNEWRESENSSTEESAAAKPVEQKPLP